MKKTTLLLSSIGSAMCLAVASTAYAQTGETSAESESNFEGVIVTATRRQESVQDVPLAVTALGGDFLRDSGITDPRDLTGLAPSLAVDQGFSQGQTHVSIRGLASSDFSLGSQSPIAIYVDDVYQSVQYGVGTQVYDLNRIEVLRGPQGTLFGKNTTGGALAYYSQTPVQGTEGYLQANAAGGDFTTYGAEGAYNVALSDTLAARFSARVDQRDAYVRNLFDGSELGEFTNANARLQFAWRPSADASLNVKFYGLHGEGDGPIYIGEYNSAACDADPAHGVFLDIYNKCDAPGGTPAPDSPDERTTYSEVPSLEDFTTYGTTIRLEQSLGDWGLTAIAGWQDVEVDLRTNDDGGGGDFFHSHQYMESTQYSGEVRLASPENYRLRGILGLYASSDELLTDQVSGSTTLDPATGFEYAAGGLTEQETTTYAIFGSSTFEFNDMLSLIAGVRYSQEEKEQRTESAFLFGFNNTTFDVRDFTEADLSIRSLLATYTLDPVNFGDTYELRNDEGSWSRTNWDLTLNFQPSDEALIYLKAATGFRSGGYPSFVTQPGTFTTFDPEDAVSYEIGFKTELFDHTLRFNGALYQVRYEDMQVQTPNTNGPGLVITNAADSEINGLELELQYRPTPELSLHLTAGYTDAEYVDYIATVVIPAPGGGTTTLINDYSGNRLPYAPRLTGSVGGSYEWDVGADHSIRFGTDWTYRSSIFFDPYASSLAKDDAYLLGDLDLSYGTSGPGWRVTGYVQNVTDENVKGFQFQLSYVSPAIYQPRRLIGVRASLDF